MRANYLRKFGLISGFLLAGLAVQAEEQVLCIATKNVLVYEADLKGIVFSGERFEAVAPFQGWGENSKVTKVGGKKVTYVRVQFTDREEEDADNDIGWVKSTDVKAKSECAGYIEPKDKDEGENKVVTAAVESDDKSVVSDLNDADCCRFPLATSAQADYTTGMRRFGYSRSGGARKHAAADLYHRQLEPVYAVADGVILRDREAFYGGTSATEIRHSGGFIGRYGELAFNSEKKIDLDNGTQVKAGQLIGYMKATRARKGFNHPMLHFELYKGSATGDLTQPDSKLGYKRRSDLVNPTPYLQKWEGHRG